MTIEYFFKPNGKTDVTKTKEKNVEKDTPDLYKAIMAHCCTNLQNISFPNKIWHYFNNIHTVKKCEHCLINNCRWVSLQEGYKKHCSNACSYASGDRVKKAKLTNIERYGVDNPLKSKEIQEKNKLIILEKYGVDNIMKSKKFRDKAETTNIERYGVKNVFQSEDIKKIVKHTMLERYGVEHPSQSKDLLKLKEDNFIVKYGMKNQFQKPENKIKAQIALNSDKTKQVRIDTSYRKFITLIEEKYKGLNIESINDDRSIDINCSKCNTTYNIQNNLLQQRYFRDCIENPCLNCFKVEDSFSIGEQELYNFVKEIDDKIEVLQRDRSILKPKELDIYIPSKKLAIEYNGLYYHSDVYGGQDKHLLKMKLCQELGISLINIFEDQWKDKNKKEIVKSRIKNFFGLNDKIYARKCMIKKMKFSEVHQFLIENHIQGSTKSKHNYGLFFENKLVSVMTFSKARKIFSNKNNGYELIRMCSLKGLNVIGGSSKMFKYFLKDVQPNNVYTYADRCWTNSKDVNVYTKMNFEFVSETVPNYWYIKSNKRFHRYNFRKDVLIKNGYDKEKTEKQIMKDLNYHRIYDCGNYKFAWHS